MTKDTIESVCEKINKRIKYGYKNEYISSRAYKIMWSKNAKKWFINDCQCKVKSCVKIDANEVLVYGTKKDIISMLDQLPAHPLFKNSFETVLNA